MKTLMMVQGSDLWWEARRALPTASNFDKILTPVKGTPSASQEAYICELLSEAAMLLPNYLSTRGVWRGTQAMRDGTDTEPEARRWYAMEAEAQVQQVGFCLSDCGRYGCSPDGLVGEDGVLELKCPLLETHMGYLLKGTLPNDYKCQVHGQLIVTGRAWVDFVSYHPDMPQAPLMVRVTPDEFTDKLRAELERFLEKYHAAAKRLGVMLTLPDGEVLEPQEAF